MKATAIGGIAVLLWATLALFTVLSGRIPPFQLLAMSFAVASVIGLVWSMRRRGGLKPALKVMAQPPRVLLLGICGLFGYHFCYFMALRLAPPVEANLLNYLWPLLIVLFSALLPGHRLRWFHLVGALLGLIGTVLIVAGVDSEGSSAPAPVLGLGVALIAALFWSSYSVLNRRFTHVPTDAVAGYCLATVLLASVAHLVFEQTVIPNTTELLAALALGLGPVGGAFFVWDYGTKQGDIRVLGALSYLAPLLSTISLVAIGVRPFDLVLGLACLLTIGGAVIASAEMWQRKSTSSAEN
ncbi:MAG: EamA family transporter [Alphaproteobacteria bacterium]|nr:EamA family transporter [Alphaproteobacteria bacterium SS10]